MEKTLRDYKKENEMLKQLLRNGFFWINYNSTDCDGCTSQSAIQFKSIKEYEDWIDDSIEWVEGSFYYDLAGQYPDGSFDLNEDSSGGQWSR
tara:strand:- start:728 stop:1003 length:276 start_codon:yes stop_codon:yes gene_type:complete